MKARPLLLIVSILFICACGKDKDAKSCLVQSMIETRNGSPIISSFFTYDGSNRLLEVSRTDLPESPDNRVKTTTYTYDDKGRVIEIVHRYSVGGRTEDALDIETFDYNELNQVITKVVYVKHGTNARTELQRLEFTYAKPFELKMEKLYFEGALQVTSEYTYTSGLMTRVKETFKDQRTHEVEIKYDGKKNPYSTSPALLAIQLGYGYPHQHNISSLSGKLSGGRSYTTSMNYTYSENGYPETAQEITSQEGSGLSLKYNYNCF
ncbi:hypothetical protein [Pontibacter vulgaris]|uniref:hypothetical protein n=1 Tax=Pontibacter vulgaris TaxID=2905679 RepID=UPI001FA7CDA4|nr:hypothetical protein [Pontibacter vulgaris]